MVVLTVPELMATSPRPEHPVPKCSDEQWDDASLLACGALKGFPSESVLKAKDLQKVPDMAMYFGQNFLMKWHHISTQQSDL